MFFHTQARRLWDDWKTDVGATLQFIRTFRERSSGLQLHNISNPIVKTKLSHHIYFGLLDWKAVHLWTLFVSRRRLDDCIWRVADDRNWSH